MKRNYPGYSYFLPLMLWSDLATTALGMMLASGQAIGYRTGRIALAGAAPAVRRQHRNFGISDSDPRCRRMRMRNRITRGRTNAAVRHRVALSEQQDGM